MVAARELFPAKYRLGPRLVNLATTIHNSRDRLMETRILVRILHRMNQVDAANWDENWYAIEDDIKRRHSNLNSGRSAVLVAVALCLSCTPD